MELAKHSRGFPKSAHGPPCSESGGTLRSAVADASLQAGQMLLGGTQRQQQVRLECTFHAACSSTHRPRTRLWVAQPATPPAGAVSRPPLAVYAFSAFASCSARSGNWNGYKAVIRRKAAASQRQGGRFAVPRSPQHPLGPYPHELNPQPKWVSAAASRHQACRRCSCHRRPHRQRLRFCPSGTQRFHPNACHFPASSV